MARIKRKAVDVSSVTTVPDDQNNASSSDSRPWKRARVDSVTESEPAKPETLSRPDKSTTSPLTSSSARSDDDQQDGDTIRVVSLGNDITKITAQVAKKASTPHEPSFVKAPRAANLKFDPPLAEQGQSRLPPIANFAARPRRVKRAKRSHRKFCKCQTDASLFNIEKCICCCNILCNKWFHLKCVGFEGLPPGRYGWCCDECRNDEDPNGLFSAGTRVDWLGHDSEVEESDKF